MKYINIIKKIEDQIDLLLTDYRNLFDEEELNYIKRIKFEMLLNQTEIDSDIDMKSFEIALRPLVAKVWKEELTKFSDIENGQDFKLVICQNDDVNEDIIYANYITSKLADKTDKNYGLVCEVDEKNLIMSSYEKVEMDFYSSRLLIVFFRSLVEMFGDKFLMTEKYVMGLNFPFQIEKETNLDKSDNLIVLKRENVKFSGVVLFEPCSSYDFEQAQLLADKYNLDIIKLTKENYKKIKQIEKN